MSSSRPLLDNSPRKSKQPRQRKILQNLNKVAGIFHWLMFIGALVMSFVFRSKSFMAQITVDFKRYDATPPLGTPPQAGNFSTTLESRGFYQLIWVDVAFHFITGLFHILIGFAPVVTAYYMQKLFVKNQSPLRWIEYSITATTMTWTIMQVSGITNIFILVLGAIVGNIVLQLQGYQMEKMKGRSWVPMISGWIIFLGQWSTIFSYFFTAISSNRPIGVASAPVYTYFIVIGLFFLFSMFGLIQVTHFAKWPRFMGTVFAQEVAFLVMSFVAKTFLTWTLLIGIATNPLA